MKKKIIIISSIVAVLAVGGISGAVIYNNSNNDVDTSAVIEDTSINEETDTSINEEADTITEELSKEEKTTSEKNTTEKDIDENKNDSTTTEKNETTTQSNNQQSIIANVTAQATTQANNTTNDVPATTQAPTTQAPTTQTPATTEEQKPIATEEKKPTTTEEKKSTTTEEQKYVEKASVERVEPTCTNAGYEDWKDSNGKVTSHTYLAPTGHDYVTTTETKEYQVEHGETHIYGDSGYDYTLNLGFTDFGQVCDFINSIADNDFIYNGRDFWNSGDCNVYSHDYVWYETKTKTITTHTCKICGHSYTD